MMHGVFLAGQNTGHVHLELLLLDEERNRLLLGRIDGCLLGRAGGPESMNARTHEISTERPVLPGRRVVRADTAVPG